MKVTKKEFLFSLLLLYYSKEKKNKREKGENTGEGSRFMTCVPVPATCCCWSSVIIFSQKNSDMLTWTC